MYKKWDKVWIESEHTHFTVIEVRADTRTQHVYQILSPVGSVRQLYVDFGSQAEPVDFADDMCVNCVTPWKCNGPHLTRNS